VFDFTLPLVMIYIYFLARCGPTRAMASSFTRFLDHTQRHITVGRTPLDEWSARRRDLNLTTHNTHDRQTSMPPVGFEPSLSAGDRPKTYALDRAATGTGIHTYIYIIIFNVRSLKTTLIAYFRCYTVHVVELLNYYTNYRTYIKFTHQPFGLGAGHLQFSIQFM